MIKTILITGALMVSVVLVVSVASAEDKKCKDCTYEKPCTFTEMNGCQKTSYDVFCMRDGTRQVWLTGNARSIWFEKCTTEIDNPFKKNQL